MCGVICELTGIQRSIGNIEFPSHKKLRDLKKEIDYMKLQLQFYEDYFKSSLYKKNTEE